MLTIDSLSIKRISQITRIIELTFEKIQKNTPDEKASVAAKLSLAIYKVFLFLTNKKMICIPHEEFLEIIKNKSPMVKVILNTKRDNETIQRDLLFKSPTVPLDSVEVEVFLENTHEKEEDERKSYIHRS